MDHTIDIEDRFQVLLLDFGLEQMDPIIRHILDKYIWSFSFEVEHQSYLQQHPKSLSAVQDEADGGHEYLHEVKGHKFEQKSLLEYLNIVEMYSSQVD